MQQSVWNSSKPVFQILNEFIENLGETVEEQDDLNVKNWSGRGTDS